MALARFGICLSLAFLIACGSSNPSQPDLSTKSWQEIEALANDQTVTFALWMGDPYINAYMRDYVAIEVKQRYGIELNLVAAQGGQIIAALMTEKEAGKHNSEYDMVWINGETFYQLRQIDALYGPFTQKLPNAQFIDFENPFIGKDFQQSIDGMECPWGNVQMALIYDTERVKQPPQNLQALEAWLKANPGRFTFDTSFTGMTLLKSWLIALADQPEALYGPFDQDVYKSHSQKLWDYVNRIKPYLWREGRSFPNGVAQLHQMFANGEVDFTMSNNDGEVDNKVLQGLFPNSARAYVPEDGTIQNSHYLGVLAGARQKAAALVTINFMISPQAQLHKMDPGVWGDGTILDIERLPQEWKDKFHSIPNRVHSPPRSEIQSRAHLELAPEYMIRLYEDFRRFVLD